MSNKWHSINHKPKDDTTVILKRHKGKQEIIYIGKYKEGYVTGPCFHEGYASLSNFDEWKYAMLQ